MSITDKISAKWQAVFFDATGCGMTEDQAEQAANCATAGMRALLRCVERAQAPQTPRHANLAGRRQAAARRAG